MNAKEEQELIDRLGRISQRINQIDSLEARATLVRGWAAIWSRRKRGLSNW
jgi:hypothetical protein